MDDQGVDILDRLPPDAVNLILAEDGRSRDALPTQKLNKTAPTEAEEPVCAHCLVTINQKTAEMTGKTLEKGIMADIITVEDYIEAQQKLEDADARLTKAQQEIEELKKQLQKKEEVSRTIV